MNIDHFCKQGLEIADEKVRAFVTFELIYKGA